ncbi:MAG: AAA-like domain-containing protein [Candidatus Aminicenantes bacterium]|nr:AAA-like domain-containing protein [Candidatus Aminicenantes bacterium]
MSGAGRRGGDFYVTGGTIAPDAPSYIEREADNELLERTLAGDFCYVLTPRQMGKSSLMARTAQRLKKQNVSTAIVDLSQIGSEKGKESADFWYRGIAAEICDWLGIKTDLSTWWEGQKHLLALQRLSKFFRDVVLEEVNSRVVIFVDEIDTTISLPFSDDFFAAVRACYNARATQPEYRRLSFVLLGVATPSQLIKDAARTPFNIGFPIELDDFTPQEALPLAVGLNENRSRGEALLERILYWSGGHPYLTQRLCFLAAEEGLGDNSEEYIDALVEKHFLTQGASHQENNLNYVRDRLLHKKNPVRKILKLYRRILRGSPVIDSPLSLTHTVLKLSGAASPREDRRLEVRNPIYERVFSPQWVKQEMPTDWARNITVASLAAILAVLVILVWVILPRQYIETIRTARDDVPLPAYEKLRKIPFNSGRADELLARYWGRRALRAEAQGERDEGILYRLQALKVKDTDARRSAVGCLIQNDYENLSATYRHNSAVFDAAFSPDGRFVLTGSYDNARLWRTDTGEPVRKIGHHNNSILAVSFSPDGSNVITGSMDKTARLWRMDTGEAAGRIMKHDDWVRAAAFSPDGRFVLTGSSDNTARLWSADTGQPVGKIMKHDGSVHSATFSPNGSFVLTGSGTTARLCCTDTGEAVGRIMKHDSFVFPASFSPDGGFILTGSQDKTARLWSTDTGEPVGKIMKHNSSVFAASFSPDGRFVLTGSDDGTARLWRTDTGEPVGKIMKHNSSVFAASFSPDGRFVLTGSFDDTARLWTLDTSEPVGKILKHDGWITAVSFSPDENTVLIGDSNATSRRWKVDTGKPMGKPIKYGESGYVVSFSPDGRFVLTGSLDGTARLWRTDTGEAVGKVMKHDDRVRTVAFSPNGRFVLTGSQDKTARLWRTDTGEAVGNVMKHGDRISASAFSPDSRLVLTGSHDETARLWRTDTGEPVGKMMQHDGSVYAAAFSPDGNTVITGTYNGIRMWRVPGGEAVGEIIEYEFSLLAELINPDKRDVFFSPDGRFVMIVNNFWIHQYVVAGDTIEHKASRLLPGPYGGAYHFLDEKGDKLQVAVEVTSNSIKICEIRFDIPDAEPVQGKPADLLQEWQKKLALKLNEKTGKIEPMYPLRDAPRRRDR